MNDRTRRRIIAGGRPAGAFRYGAVAGVLALALTMLGGVQRLTGHPVVPARAAAISAVAPYCAGSHALVVDGHARTASVTLHGAQTFAAVCIVNGGTLRADGNLLLRLTGTLYLDRQSEIDASGAPGDCSNTQSPTSDGGNGVVVTVVAAQAIIQGRIVDDGGAGVDGHVCAGEENSQQVSGGAGGNGGQLIVQTRVLTLTGTLSARGGNGGPGYRDIAAGDGGSGGTITLFLTHPSAALRSHLDVRGGTCGGACGTSKGGTIGQAGTAQILPLTAAATVPHERGWYSEFSPVTDDLSGVACPGMTICYATDKNGTAIVATTDGGATWHTQRTPDPRKACQCTSYPDFTGITCPSVTTCYALSEYALLAIRNGGLTWIGLQKNSPTGLACPSVTTCYGVADSGIVVTRNGGATWQSVYTVPTSSSLLTEGGIACPSVTVCYVTAINVAAAGGNDTIRILLTRNGGRTWQVQAFRNITGHDDQLYAIACPGLAVCHAVGDVGLVLSTMDGGATWQSLTGVGLSSDLYGVACPAAATCYAVGAFGTVIATTRGGTTASAWSQQVTPATNIDLHGIACPSVTTCYAVGDKGTILATTTGGV